MPNPKGWSVRVNAANDFTRPYTLPVTLNSLSFPLLKCLIRFLDLGLAIFNFLYSLIGLKVKFLNSVL